MKKSYVIYGRPYKEYHNHCHSREEETEKGSNSLFKKKFKADSLNTGRDLGNQVMKVKDYPLIKNDLKTLYNKIVKVKHKERIF